MRSVSLFCDTICDLNRLPSQSMLSSTLRPLFIYHSWRGNKESFLQVTDFISPSFALCIVTTYFTSVNCKIGLRRYLTTVSDPPASSACVKSSDFTHGSSWGNRYCFQR